MTDWRSLMHNFKFYWSPPFHFFSFLFFDFSSTLDTMNLITVKLLFIFSHVKRRTNQQQWNNIKSSVLLKSLVLIRQAATKDSKWPKNGRSVGGWVPASGSLGHEFESRLESLKESRLLELVSVIYFELQKSCCFCLTWDHKLSNA